MRTALAALALCVLAAAAQAEEAPACTQFKWPLAAERSWFEAGKLTELQSGASVGEAADGAFDLALKPSAEVSFALPPEGKPKPDKPLGAVLAFSVVAKPGTYQVTLSDEAWIDIVQDGAYRPSLEFSGVHGCPGLRKSVRFVFKQGPLILQLSSASAPSLKLAIRRLPSP
ncbi:hypothetical protein [Taklimakanibacter deserti]|uniref:hypothetical protein n=1 Tax=Taklimakanibacter deserti TaxID=2267839 RepID=UPI000E65A05F